MSVHVSLPILFYCVLLSIRFQFACWPKRRSENFYLIYVISVCLPMVLSNTYSVVFFFSQFVLFCVVFCRPLFVFSGFVLLSINTRRKPSIINTSKVLRSPPWLGWPLWNICVTNDHGYVPLVVNTCRSFPHSWLINGFVDRVTRWVLLVEQELLTLPEHLVHPRFLVGFVLLDH